MRVSSRASPRPPPLARGPLSRSRPRGASPRGPHLPTPPRRRAAGDASSSTSDATPDGEERPAGAGPPPPGCTPSSPEFTPSAWRDLDIDWGRRHLQILFVDEDHGVMARAAEGACQRVAKWAGAGHMVFPESAGLAVPTTPPAAPDADAAMRLVSRLAPVCDHPRYATKPPYRFTDGDAACVDLVVSVGGAETERRCRDAAPSAAAVVDLWEFAQFAEMAEIDGAGAAAVVQRSLALDVVKPRLEEALRGAAVLEPAATRAYGVWANDGRGRSGASGEARRGREEALEEARREEALEVARARVVIGVAGLVTFLIAIAPVEEVTRVTKR